jgi:RHS repeat-associated protein
MSGGTVVYAIATAYNADNEITSMSDPDSASAMTYDNLGQTLTVDNAGTPAVPHVVLTGSYDAGGDRTSLAARINGTPDLLNTYSFDADQRLTGEVQQQQSGGNGVAPKEVDFGYNALGQFKSAARYDFIGVGPRTDIATGAFSYDAANRLTGLNYTYGGGGYSIDGYTLAYDNADRLTTSTSTADGTANYGYDSTNQIASASYSGTNAPLNAAYSFDKNGNRAMPGYQTGTDNLLTSDGTFNYQHDADGNRTVRTRISNAPANDYQVKSFYDYRNRETDEEYFNNSGVLTKHVHLVYDTLDNEIGEQVDDTGGGTYDRTERYVLDGTQPVAQFDGGGNLTERNLNGPSPTGVDAVLAQEAIGTQGQSGTTDWDLTDELGTTRNIINNGSAVIDHVIGDAFGQTTSESNTSIAHWDGFAGGHTDADTGDVLNGERRYDASTGDWTTKDPIGFTGGDANTGRYSGNSPTNLVDPKGLAPQGSWNGGDYNGNPALEQSYADWMMGGPSPVGLQRVFLCYTRGTPSMQSWQGQTWGWGQNSNQCMGNVSNLMGPYSAMVNVTVNGPEVCNTCQMYSDPAAHAGTLSAWIANYPPGWYNVQVTYTAVLTTTGSGVTGSATIFGPGNTQIQQMRSPMPGGAPGIHPSFISTTMTLPVQLTGGAAHVMTIRPVLAGPGTGSASYSGAISVGPVTPLHPVPAIGGVGGGF